MNWRSGLSLSSVVCSIVLGTGHARAQPGAKGAPASHPAPAPMCAPSDDDAEYRLVADGPEVIACWRKKDKPAEKCVAATVSGRLHEVPTPPADDALASGATVREEGRKLSACAGSRCVKIGKKLAAAIAREKAKADKQGEDYYGDPVPCPTTDLTVVGLAGRAWDVAHDKVITLKPPREYAKAKEGKPEFQGVRITGPFAIATWSSCAAEGCVHGVLFDAAGKNRGAWFSPGEAIMLDDKRAIVIPQGSEPIATVIDVATATQLGTLDLGPLGGDGTSDHLTAAKVDAGTVAVLSVEQQLTLARIGISPAGVPSLTSTTKLPTCPAEDDRSKIEIVPSSARLPRGRAPDAPGHSGPRPGRTTK